MTTDDIAHVEALMFDLLKVGAQFYPPLAIALPILQSLVIYEGAKIRAGLADGSIIPDGQGGFVSKAWAEDPRHQLNPDGSFRF
jgi:hypothetical protein